MADLEWRSVPVVETPTGAYIAGSRWTTHGDPDDPELGLTIREMMRRVGVLSPEMVVTREDEHADSIAERISGVLPGAVILRYQDRSDGAISREMWLLAGPELV